ncbi:thioredoxin TrxC [Azospirillum sp.]|uniref:thioredoxin TrxC n=1 Tax=Azospirillum sp. TaxID=34012 RepID=UPI003D718A7C
MHVVCPHCDTVNRIPDNKPVGRGKCGQCHHALFDGHPVALTAERFRAHAEKGDLPLLIDFWAPWCGPCRAMAPAFEQAAQALEPRVRLVKVNTDEEQQLAAMFGVQSIPTLALVHKGREIARTAGAMPAAALVQWVQGRLA